MLFPHLPIYPFMSCVFWSPSPTLSALPYSVPLPPCRPFPYYFCSETTYLDGEGAEMDPARLQVTDFVDLKSSNK